MRTKLEGENLRLFCGIVAGILRDKGYGVKTVLRVLRPNSELLVAAAYGMASTSELPDIGTQGPTALELRGVLRDLRESSFTVGALRQTLRHAAP